MSTLSAFIHVVRFSAGSLPSVFIGVLLPMYIGADLTSLALLIKQKMARTSQPFS